MFTWMHPLDKICLSNSVIRCCLRLLVSYLLATWPAMILCWSRKSLTNSRFDSVATPSKKGRRRAHAPEVWFRVLGQQIIRSFSMVCWFVAVAATRFPSECWRLVQPPQPQHLPCRFLFRTYLIDTVPRVCIVFGQGLPRLFLDQELVFGVHQRIRDYCCTTKHPQWTYTSEQICFLSMWIINCVCDLLLQIFRFTFFCGCSFRTDHPEVWF